MTTKRKPIIGISGSLLVRYIERRLRIHHPMMRKLLNILVEQDHRPVKRRNKFYRSLRTASPTIKGMEAIRGLYKKTRKEGTLFGFSVCTEIKVLLGIPD